MNLPSKKFWLSVLSFLVLVGGLVGGAILVKQRQIIEKKAVEGANAALELLSSLSVIPNDEFDVPLMVNTDGVPIVGVDAILNFNKNLLKLVNITPRPENSSLKTYLPLNESGGFDSAKVISRANQSGKIEFGVVTWAADSPTQGFNGVLGLTNPLATLRFKALQVGQTTVNFVFSPGSTTDSNLVRITDTAVVDILARVTNLSLKIILPATPTPTPTLTPTPTPTPRPTVTPTPTPILSPTPTPTTEPTKANLTFSLKLQGISTCEGKLDKTARVTIGSLSSATVNISCTENGIYQGTVYNLDPGTYDVLIKSWAHLQKKFASVTLVEGENIQDFSQTKLLAGDTNNDDLINTVDIAKVIDDYFPETPADSPADFNLDSTVNAVDIGFVIENYFFRGEE